MDPSGSSRGMLPACVVKMRSVLCCMAPSPAWAYASFLASEVTILRRYPRERRRAQRWPRCRRRYRRALAPEPEVRTPRAANVNANFGSARADALPFQRAADLIQDHRIVDRRRQCPRVAVGDLLHGAAQDLART